MRLEIGFILQIEAYYASIEAFNVTPQIEAFNVTPHIGAFT